MFGINFEYTHAKMTSLIIKNKNEKKQFGLPHIHWNLSDVDLTPLGPKHLS